MHKILLADDHTIIRTGLKLVLKECFSNCEICEAVNGNEILGNLRRNTYNLMIMDIQMPGTDALEMTTFISATYPATHMLIFSISPEEIYATRFLKEGAKGFISKDASLEELKDAIIRVINGRMFLSKKLTESLAHKSFWQKPLNPFDALSKREFEVASRMLSGENLNAIAQNLHLSASTVGTHKARLFEKLNVANLLQLKALADVYKINTPHQRPNTVYDMKQANQ